MSLVAWPLPERSLVDSAKVIGSTIPLPVVGRHGKGTTHSVCGGTGEILWDSPKAWKGACFENGGHSNRKGMSLASLTLIQIDNSAGSTSDIMILSLKHHKEDSLPRKSYRHWLIGGFLSMKSNLLCGPCLPEFSALPRHSARLCWNEGSTLFSL